MQAHYVTTDAFSSAFGDLDNPKKDAFLSKLTQMIDDCKATKPGQSPSFRRGLRIHPLKGTDPTTYSMTWAMDWFDGRATFLMVVSPDAITITWLDIGGHEIYR